MITKGGLETITQHLAMEYAKDGTLNAELDEAMWRTDDEALSRGK